MGVLRTVGGLLAVGAALTAVGLWHNQGVDIRRGGDSVEDWLLKNGGAHKIGSWAAGHCVNAPLNVRKLTEDEHDGLGGMFSDLEYDGFEGPATGMTAEITDFGARDDGTVLLAIGAVGTGAGQINARICRGEGGTGTRFSFTATLPAGGNAGMTLIARTPEAAPAPSN